MRRAPPRRGLGVPLVAALSVVLLLALACCYLPPPSGGSSPSPPPAPTPTLDALERHLLEGAAWGGTPEALRLATDLHAGWLPHSADGVAVEVLPGAVSRIDVLVRIHDDSYSGLADMDDGERRGLLSELSNAVAMSWDGGPYYLCVAMRGSVFYGALMEAEPGVAPVFVTEFSISHGRVERCLVGPTHAATPPLPPMPPPG